MIRPSSASLALAASVVLGIAAGVIVPASPVAAAEFRQIVLDHHAVKWGDARPGVGAVVTYAVAEEATRFPGARNCNAIQSFVGLLANSGISRATLDAELSAAFDAWSDAANIRFEVTSPALADILIGAESVPLGRAFTNVTYAESRVVGAPVSLDGSVICLNPLERWKAGFDGDLTAYDLRYTFMHEIGHAIGLDHPGRIGELMDFRYSEEFRVPQLGDIAGAVFLYGPSRVAAVSGADLHPVKARISLGE